MTMITKLNTNHLRLALSSAVLLVMASTTLPAAATTDQFLSIATSAVSDSTGARHLSDVGFEHDGKVSQIMVQEGDFVSAGALLAKLDSRALELERHQLQTQLAETHSELASHLDESANGGDSAGPQLMDLDTHKLYLTASISRIESAITSLDRQIQNSELFAPFDGIVAGRFADQGSNVVAGAPVLRLQPAPQMDVRLSLNQ